MQENLRDGLDYLPQPRSPQPNSPAFNPRMGRAAMGIFDALRLVAEGERITKLEWQDKDTYCLMAGGFLSIHNGGEDNNVFHAWMITDGDMARNDWVVLA